MATMYDHEALVAVDDDDEDPVAIDEVEGMSVPYSNDEVISIIPSRGRGTPMPASDVLEISRLKNIGAFQLNSPQPARPKGRSRFWNKKPEVDSVPGLDIKTQLELCLGNSHRNDTLVNKYKHRYQPEDDVFEPWRACGGTRTIGVGDNLKLSRALQHKTLPDRRRRAEQRLECTQKLPDPVEMRVEQPECRLPVPNKQPVSPGTVFERIQSWISDGERAYNSTNGKTSSALTCKSDARKFNYEDVKVSFVKAVPKSQHVSNGDLKEDDPLLSETKSKLTRRKLNLEIQPSNHSEGNDARVRPLKNSTCKAMRVSPPLELKSEGTCRKAEVGTQTVSFSEGDVDSVSKVKSPSVSPTASLKPVASCNGVETGLQTVCVNGESSELMSISPQMATKSPKTEEIQNGRVARRRSRPASKKRRKRKSEKSAFKMGDSCILYIDESADLSDASTYALTTDSSTPSAVIKTEFQPIKAKDILSKSEKQNKHSAVTSVQKGEFPSSSKGEATLIGAAPPSISTKKETPQTFIDFGKKPPSRASQSECRPFSGAEQTVTSKMETCKSGKDRFHMEDLSLCISEIAGATKYVDPSLPNTTRRDAPKIRIDLKNKSSTWVTIPECKPTVAKENIITSTAETSQATDGGFKLGEFSQYFNDMATGGYKPGTFTSSTFWIHQQSKIYPRSSLDVVHRNDFAFGTNKKDAFDRQFRPKSKWTTDDFPVLQDTSNQPVAPSHSTMATKKTDVRDVKIPEGSGDRHVIVIENIPRTVTEEHLREYLEAFGGISISNISLHESPDGGSHAYAMVFGRDKCEWIIACLNGSSLKPGDSEILSVRRLPVSTSYNK